MSDETLEKIRKTKAENMHLCRQNRTSAEKKKMNIENKERMQKSRENQTP